MYSDAMLDKMTKDESIVGYALEILFGSGEPTHVHTGVGNRVIGGDLYRGVGDLGTVGAVPSTSDASPARVTCTLNGLPNSILPTVLEGGVRGRPVKLITVVYSDTGDVLMAEITVQGTITDYTVTTGDNNSLSIQISDEFEKFEKPLLKFWSNESFRNDYPASGLCRYSAQTADREIQWGSKNDAPQMRYLK